MTSMSALTPPPRNRFIVWIERLLVAASLVLIVPSVKLYRNCDMQSAQRLMFGSFMYLPVVQIVLMLGKLF